MESILKSFSVLVVNSLIILKESKELFSSQLMKFSPTPELFTASFPRNALVSISFFPKKDIKDEYN